MESKKVEIKPRIAINEYGRWDVVNFKKFSAFDFFRPESWLTKATLYCIDKNKLIYEPPTYA